MALLPPIKGERISKYRKLSEKLRKLEEVKESTMKLETEYSAIFPKVSPKLIKDLLCRQAQEVDKILLYTLKVFTKEVGEGGIDSNTIREHI